VDSFLPLRQLAKKAQELIEDQFAILLYIANGLTTHRMRPSPVTYPLDRYNFTF
jgi:hypothetical protein